jgi:FixJ family two-component response regulator
VPNSLSDFGLQTSEFGQIKCIMENIPETVFIIDDDRSIRRSLSLFLMANGYIVETYSSSEEYLEREVHNGTGCIILDVNLEGKSGLELQEELLNSDSYLPIIFITGQGSIQMSVQTLKKGAVDFLEKPFKDDDLLRSISSAIILSQKLKEENKEARRAKKMIDALTPRELEVLKYLLSGMLNKQIASELNIVEHTVKLHRHSICEKFGVKSVPEILRIADKAGIISFENKY